MIFSDSPSQKALKRMMTQVKGFPPRGSGVMVLRRFEYTAEMCDCRLCLYYHFDGAYAALRYAKKRGSHY